VASKALSSKQLNRSLNIIEGQSKASNTNIEIKALMDRVKNIVGNNLGIIRNELSLTEGQKQLSKLWLEIKDLGEQDRDVFELKQMARLANLMIEAASRRTESRGVQFRSDFNALDDAWAKTQTLIKD
jgi:succinate dehydrogenase/fumarate reductase flavoprotein subunit